MPEEIVRVNEANQKSDRLLLFNERIKKIR